MKGATRKAKLTPRRYGGLIIVTPIRNRYETADDRFSVAYHSTDGSIAWLSHPLASLEHASAAASCLAEFLGATVRPCTIS